MERYYHNGSQGNRVGSCRLDSSGSGQGPVARQVLLHVALLQQLRNLPVQWNLTMQVMLQPIRTNDFGMQEKESRIKHLHWRTEQKTHKYLRGITEIHFYWKKK
jgi:hypothetical protein